MNLSEEAIEAHVMRLFVERFGGKVADYSKKDNLAKKFYFNEKSLRNFGDRKLRRAVWYTGWFAPSEIIECQTIGDIIKMLFETRNRPKPRVAGQQWSARVALAGAA